MYTRGTSRHYSTAAGFKHRVKLPYRLESQASLCSDGQNGKKDEQRPVGEHFCLQVKKEMKTTELTEGVLPIKHGGVETFNHGSPAANVIPITFVSMTGFFFFALLFVWTFHKLLQKLSSFFRRKLPILIMPGRNSNILPRLS